MNIDLPEPTGTRIREAVGLIGRRDRHIACSEDVFARTVTERRLSFDHEEQFRIRVLVELGALTGC